MEQAIKLLGWAISPRTIWDLVVYGLVFAVLSTLFFVKLGKPENRWSNALKSGSVLGAVSLLYVLSFAYIIPIFQRFPEDTAGILIARFSGHTLQENLGGQNLNEAICQTIQSLLPEYEAKMDLPGVNAAIGVRAISWEVDSEKEAASMRRKYRASAILWGSVMRLGNEAKITGGFDLEPLTFFLEGASLKGVGEVFNLSIGPEISLGLSDSGYNLPSIGRTIVNDFLPILATKVYPRQPQLAVTLIEKMPSIDSSCKYIEYGGFLLFFAAQTFDELGQADKAVEYYGISFDYLKKAGQKLSADRKPFAVKAGELADVMNSGTYPEKILFYDPKASVQPPCDTCEVSVIVRRFMAAAKWKEGQLLLKKNDTERAAQCFISALFVADSALQPIILSDCRRRGFILDSVVVSPALK